MPLSPGTGAAATAELPLALTAKEALALPPQVWPIAMLADIRSRHLVLCTVFMKLIPALDALCTPHATHFQRFSTDSSVVCAGHMPPGRRHHIPSSEHMWAQSQGMHMAESRPGAHMMPGMPMQMPGNYMVQGMMPGMMAGVPIMGAGLTLHIAPLMCRLTDLS